MNPICKARIRGKVGASARSPARSTVQALKAACVGLNAGDKEQEAELDLPADTAATLRSMHLSALPKDASAYADVPTDELPDQEGYERAEEPESDADAEAEDEDTADDLRLPPPLGADPDAPKGDHVSNPIHLERRLKSKVRREAAGSVSQLC